MPIRQTVVPLKKVLLIELSEMGSAILADPAMRKLQRILNAELHFVIFSKNRASLTLLDTVPSENVFVIRDDSLWSLALDTFSFLRWVRKRRIDTVIDLELFSRYTALLTGFCGAFRRVGFYAFHNEGLYRGNFLTHNVPYNPHLHIAKNFIALVNSLLTGDGNSFSKTVVSDDEIILVQRNISQLEQAGVREKIKRESARFDWKRHKIILFNANASDMLPQRCWPSEYYRQVAGTILEQHENAYILFTGNDSEREGISSLVSQVAHPRCLNFAGKTSLTELTALYSISEFMLSNDSGPAHFAAVTPLQTYTLFGPETPKLYGPLGQSVCISAEISCSPCVSAANHRKTSCQDNQCLQALHPRHILDILRPRLARLNTP